MPASLTISRSDRAASHLGGISLGAPQHRWLLFLGDALLIMLANFLSSWIRFGLFSNTLYVYGLAVAVTLVVYPSTLYVFDLYNLERTFRSWETAFRSSFTVVSGGIVSVVVFYLLPQGAYGRGIMAIQMGLIWLFLNGWRWAYGALFQASAIGRTPTLVLGAGQCGKAIYDLLCSPFSPYEVKGFLDDDLSKQGHGPVGVRPGDGRSVAERSSQGSGRLPPSWRSRGTGRLNWSGTSSKPGSRE